MNIEEVRDYCLSLPHTTEDFPFDETTLAFRIEGKIFAMIDLENTQWFVLKCEPEYAIELREKYPEIQSVMIGRGLIADPGMLSGGTDIAALEGKIEENQAAQAAAGSDYVKLQQLQDELAQLEETLEQKTERWMYLTELAEKIEAQKK